MKETKNTENLEEIKEFYLSYQDDFEDFILFLEDEMYLIDKIYSEESNWNNGDINSGQYSRSKEEISSLIYDVLEYLKKQDYRCPECAMKYNDDNYITVSEPRPYGESCCYESVAIGYRCKCGYGEKY